MEGSAQEAISTARRLVAVVVTHNRPGQLATTLERLFQNPPGILDAVVVVDNASDPETPAMLAHQHDPRLVTLRSETNLGGAGGFEMGMKQAVARFDPDWLVVMDDDGRPAPGALGAFHALDLSGWEALSAAVRFPDGRICDMNRPARNPFWHGREFLSTIFRGRRGFHLGPDDYVGDRVLPVDVSSFVGFFVSRRGLDLAGLPDPRLFLYGDDGIYTLGLTAAGGRIGFAPAVRFEHDCSTFSSAQRGRFKPLWKVYYYHRNLLMLYRMAAGPVLFWPVLALILPKWMLKVRHHGGQRAAYLRFLRLAVWDGLCKRLSRRHDTVLALDDRPPAPLRDPG